MLRARTADTPRVSDRWNRSGLLTYAPVTFRLARARAHRANVGAGVCAAQPNAIAYMAQGLQ